MSNGIFFEGFVKEDGTELWDPFGKGYIHYFHIYYIMKIVRALK